MATLTTRALVRSNLRFLQAFQPWQVCKYCALPTRLLLSVAVFLLCTHLVRCPGAWFGGRSGIKEEAKGRGTAA
jgi:hypothetical protein